MDSMDYFIWPAVIALCVKLLLIIVARKGAERTSTLFYTMLLVFVCHNTAEILGFLEFFSARGTDLLLRWYYVSCVAGLFVIALYAMEISKSKFAKMPVKVVLFVISAGLCLAIFLSGTIVNGSESGSLIPTAAVGGLYHVFIGYCVAVYVLSIFVLISGYLRAKDHRSQIRCTYTIVALFPLLGLGLILATLKGLGYDVTAAGSIPFATTLFLLITLRSESKHNITDFRRFIPQSLERIASAHILDVFSSYARDEISHRDAMSEIEKMLVTHKHEKSGGNVSVTAAAMDLPRSTLYSIFNRLDIAATKKTGSDQ